MKSKERLILLLGLSVIHAFTCKTAEKKCCLLLPNSKIITGSTVQDFNAFIPLTYENYNGFTGYTDDAVLGKFTVVLIDQAKKVGRDVASIEYIEKLKAETFIGIEFEKIPQSAIPFDSVLKYVGRSYPNLRQATNVPEEIGIDNEVLFVEDGGVVVKVQYSKLGIPGTLVSLYCKSQKECGEN